MCKKCKGTGYKNVIAFENDDGGVSYMPIDREPCDCQEAKDESS